MGDPKMKFLRLFLSAVRSPPIRRTIKNYLDIAPVPRPTWGQYSGVNLIPFLHFRAKHWTQVERQTGAMSREVFYGRSVGQSEGSRTAKSNVGRRTDGSFYFFLKPP